MRGASFEGHLYDQIFTTSAADGEIMLLHIYLVSWTDVRAIGGYLIVESVLWFMLSKRSLVDDEIL